MIVLHRNTEMELMLTISRYYHSHRGKAMSVDQNICVLASLVIIKNLLKVFQRVHPMKLAHVRGIRQKIGFYLVKLPFILVTIIVGFLFQFLLELPFMVLCKLDRTVSDQHPGRPPQAGR